VTQHPYLWTSLFLAALCLIGLRLATHQRKPALLSAVFGIPGAAYSLVFVPTYWNPVRIVDWPIGVEDVLFSFANGGLVWLMVAVRNPGVRLSIDAVTVTKRLVALSVVFALLLLASVRAGVPVMHAGLFSAVMILSTVLWLRPRYWQLAARGMVAFGIFYGLVLLGASSLWPDALSWWHEEVVSGMLLLGAPAEEIAWAVAYGAVYPLVMAFCFDAQVDAGSVATEADGGAKQQRFGY